MAGMFNQAKDLLKMQREAGAMQKKMKGLTVSGYSDNEDVKMTINGVQDIQEIEINDELLSVEKKRELVRSIRQASKDAQNKLQKELVKDMDMDKLKSMFGS
jgi:DNA-binding protein YbaB